MGSFGIWTLMPALLVIIIALTSKKILEALFLGFLSTYVIIAVITKQNFLVIAEEAFYCVMTDRDNIWVIAVVLLFGSLSALLNASKGTFAISEAIHKRCNQEKSVGIFTWLLEIVVFIDDYLNIIAVSACMKHTFDKKKMPREVLAYIVASTGVCACVLIPFSSWAVFYSTLFYSQESVAALGFGSAIDTYYHIIPYMFYAIASMLIVLLFVLKLIPTFGPMKKAQYRERTHRGSETQENAGHIVDFLLPIGIMIAATLLFDDILISLLITVVSCLALYVPRKIMTVSRFCALWVEGMQTMLPTVLVLVFSFFMKQACIDINLPEYAIEKTIPFLSAGIFPAIAFLLVSLLSFMTGNGWSAPALCIPVIMPMASAIGADIILTMAAIVSGGVFCGNACFYSDLALLTSEACDIDTMTHIKTQLPYSLIAFTVSFALYLILGLTGGVS